MSNQQPKRFKTLREHKLTGIYILLSGPLAGILLGGPRTVGFAPVLANIAIAAFSVIIATAIMYMFFVSWRNSAPEGGNKVLTNEGKRFIQWRCYLSAALGVAVALALIAIQRTGMIAMPHEVALFLVTAAAAVVPISFDKAAAL